jgi:hypothetical protein
LLDSRNQFQAVHTVYVGSLNAAIIRAVEVFKAAIRFNSSALLVSHNHSIRYTERRNPQGSAARLRPRQRHSD